MALVAKVDRVDTRVAVHMGIVLDLAVSSIAAEVAVAVVVARGPAHPALFAMADQAARVDLASRWDHNSYIAHFRNIVYTLSFVITKKLSNANIEQTVKDEELHKNAGPAIEAMLALLTMNATIASATPRLALASPMPWLASVPSYAVIARQAAMAL